MIYRKEAVDQLRLGNNSNGTVLRATPGWVKWPFLLLLALLAILTIFAVNSTRNEYIVGVAIVRADDIEFVVASSDCIITGVFAAPGDSIQSGQELVSIATGGATSAVVVSPIRGTAVGFRVRKGQEVLKGEVLCTLAPANCSYSLTMFLPGNSKPSLKSATPVWFSAHGFENSKVELALERVNEEAVDKSEIQGLWDLIADEDILAGEPVIVAWGRLTDPLVRRDGTPIEYYDGLVGSVRVLVGTVPVIHFFSGES